MSWSPPPLVLLTLCFLAGLIPALLFEPSSAPFLVAASALLLAVLFLRGRAVTAAALGAAALTGAALGSHTAGGWRSDCRAALAEGAAVEVVGLLEGTWRPRASPADRYADERPGLVPVRASSLRSGGLSCSVGARVAFPDDQPELAAGTPVRISGSWARSAGPVSESEWPANPYYRGFVLADQVEARGAGRRNLLLTARGAVERRIHELFPAHASLVDALVLGRRESLSDFVRDRFARAGIAHILAISGLHVGLIGGALLLATRAAGLPWRVAGGATIALVALYLAMIGAPASALRAGVMISLGLLGLMLQRPFSPYPVVAVAALAILLFRPGEILSPGFQLSFLGVLGILVVRDAVLRKLPEGWLHGWRRWTAESVMVSGAAFLATTPVAAYHFGLATPAAVLANIPAIPLLSLALVGVVLALLVSLFSGTLAGLFAAGAGVALDLIDRVATVAAALPAGHLEVTRQQPLLWVAAGAVALVAAWLGRGMRGWAVALVSTGAAVAVLLAAPAFTPSGPEGLDIYFLDVGQGDATAVRTPEGRWVLVDAGPRTETYDAGERRVLPFLRRMNAPRVELLIITHPQLDHVGGAAAVLGGVEVRWVWDPAYPLGSPPYLELLELIEQKGIPWTEAGRDQSVELDGVTFELLAPAPGAVERADDPNQAGAVVRVGYGGFSALLPGDAYSAQELELVEVYGVALRADILKVGHHGSRTSTSPAFLEAVEPALAVISAGRRNPFGHPHPLVLHRLRSRGIPVARTDREGTIHLHVPAPGSRGWVRKE